MEGLDYGRIGMRIRQVRKAKGWSQEILAKKCGISLSFMGHIERGTRIMSIETFAGICEALDTNADELLWGTMHAAEPVTAFWNLNNQKAGREQEQAESYSMYIRIMESVAEIMNEA